MKYEFGLIRNQSGKISFSPFGIFDIDRGCSEGCVIYTFLCFYASKLKGECANENL